MSFKRNVFLSLYLCCTIFPLFAQDFETVIPEEVGFSSERLHRINRVMEKYIEEKKLPGVVTLILRHGKIAYFESFGKMDIEAGNAMSKDALFRIASMSKPVTTAAVMMLYEEGHFVLTDPVSEFIPEFANPQVLVSTSQGDSFYTVPAKNKLTIRHLLNHTSGITYGSGMHTDYYKNAGMTVGLTPTEGTIGEKIKKLARLPLISHPGEEFHYSMSIDVLGYLIEVISGMSLNEFLYQRIFKPLNMIDTHFILPENKLKRMAKLYRINESGDIIKDPVDLDYLLTQTYFSGGAGLISSAFDYGKFAQMILNRGEFNGIRLLSRKTLELMTTNSIGELYIPFRIVGDKFGYGFGIRTERGVYDELESLGIIGWDGAFYTRCWIDPKEELIGIFMSQVGSYWETNFAAKFRNLVYQAIND